MYMYIHLILQEHVKYKLYTFIRCLCSFQCGISVFMKTEICFGNDITKVTKMIAPRLICKTEIFKGIFDTIFNYMYTTSVFLKRTEIYQNNNEEHVFAVDMSQNDLHNLPQNQTSDNHFVKVHTLHVYIVLGFLLKGNNHFTYRQLYFWFEGSAQLNVILNSFTICELYEEFVHVINM